MRLDSTALTVLLWVVLLLHIITPIVVLFDRISWTRRFIWIAVVCVVPVLGPLYFLLFRHEWNAGPATERNFNATLKRHDRNA